MPSTPSHVAATPAGRILEVDALRGLAAMAVVLFHYTTRYEELFGHSQSLAWSVSWGHYGVDLFFMLSGFVILMTLERTPDATKFVWGRVTRLYPTYWAAATLTFCAVTCFGLPGQEVTLREALMNLTMIQALLGAPHIDGAYWSLQAELIFYANMLLLFRWGAFRRPALTVLVWLAVSGLVVLLQGCSAWQTPLVAGLLSKLATIASLKYIPLFAVGVLLYHTKQTGSFKNARLALCLCCASAGWTAGIDAMVIDALLATILWLAVSGRLSVLAARPLVSLGAISYSLYLIHQNIGYQLIGAFEARGWAPPVAVAVACLAALLIASCLHHWVERPAMARFRELNFEWLMRRPRQAATNS